MNLNKRQAPFSPFVRIRVNFHVYVPDMRSEQEKIKAYRELLGRLSSIEYQTLKKIVGHLHFIESQKIRNKMSIDNLSMIWGPTLIRNPQLEDVQYSQKECDVIRDLIKFYKDLYPLSGDEVVSYPSSHSLPSKTESNPTFRLIHLEKGADHAVGFEKISRSCRELV